MVQHVLVPLDGSALAELALSHAQSIVRKNGQITLLRMIDAMEWSSYVEKYGGVVPLGVWTPEEVWDCDHIEAKTYLQQASFKLNAPELRVRKLVCSGSPSQVIVAVAAKLGVDAIVMTTRNHKGIRRFLFGSVTQNVVSRAACSVLVVPGAQVEQSF